MAAHRYWRFSILSNNGGGGNGASVAELGLRIVAGGASVATGGTASASSTWSGSAAQAFDGNLATEWEGVGHTTDWLKYDFGVGNAYDIVEVALTTLLGGPWAPKEFTFDYSDDDINWTASAPVGNQSGWAASETRTYTVQAARITANLENPAWRTTISIKTPHVGVVTAIKPLRPIQILT